MADVEYGINVKNKFAFLEDDEHEPDQTVEEKAKQVITEAKQKKKEQRIAEKVAATKDDPKKGVAIKPDGKENHQQVDDAEGRRGGRRGGFRGGRGGRGGANRADRPPRYMTDGDQQAPSDEGDRPPRAGGYRMRGRGRGFFQTTGDREHQETEFRPRGRGGRGFRGGYRGGRGGVGNVRDESHGQNDISHWAPSNEGQIEMPQENITAHVDSGEFRGRGRGGRGGFRARGGRGAAFDRHSGSDRTGIKSVDKRGGAGKGNWGTTADELISEPEVVMNVSDNKENAIAPAADAMNGDANVQLTEAERTEEQATDERGLTLTEYKAQQQKEDSNFNTRRVHLPKDMKIIPNKLDESYEHEEIIIHQRPSKKKFVDLPLQMQNDGIPTPRRGRGAGGGVSDRGDHQRGERGAYRGGNRGASGPRGGIGGRGGQRGVGRGSYGGRGYDRSDNFNVQNESEFPAL